MIDPYEIISSDNGLTWLMEFKGKNPPSAIGSGAIDSIGVKGNYFVLYNKRADLPTGMSKAWFLINANFKEEKVFINEPDYHRYLKENNIDGIRLYYISDVFKTFDSDRPLPQDWPK